jgi:hypothetical protein
MSVGGIRNYLNDWRRNMLDRSYFMSKLKFVEQAHDKEYSSGQAEIIYDKVKWVDKFVLDKVAESMSEETYLPKPGKWMRAAYELKPADNGERNARFDTVVICTCGASFAVSDFQAHEGGSFKCPNSFYEKCNKSYTLKYIRELRDKYGRDLFMDEIAKEHK